MVLDFDMTVNS